MGNLEPNPALAPRESGRNLVAEYWRYVAAFKKANSNRPPRLDELPPEFVETQRDYRKGKDSEHRNRHKTTRDARIRDWKAKNRDKVSEANRRYREANRERIAELKRKYREREKTDPRLKLIKAARNAIRRALASRKITGRTRDLIGCDWDFLRAHIEKQWEPGMTWDNHGEWHIDHHVPLAKAAKRGENALRRAIAWQNLRPLWAADNMAKGARW